MASLTPGSNFGDYRIIEPLGRGGMATVYKAYEPGLDRYVALKVLPPEFMHDETFAERFRREAKVIAKLEHPNIVPIHAFGIDDGVPWMAMRLIAGGTVHSLTREGRLDRVRAVEILHGVADALDYAHESGVVHRDIKPQNILLDAAKRVYLADFGVARILEGSTFLTRDGAVTGTPQYMSPEQAMAQPVDRFCDIYALGIVAYEMFTGGVPFQADTPVAVLMKHVMDPIPLPPLEVVPDPLARAVLRCLAKKREDRWPSAGAFVAALEEALAKADTVQTPAVPAPPSPPAVRVAPAPRRRSGFRLLLLLLFAAAAALWAREEGWQWPSARIKALWDALPSGSGPPTTLADARPVAEPEAPRSDRTRVRASPPPETKSPVQVAPPVPPPEPAPTPPPGAKARDRWTNPRDGLEYAFVPAASRLRMGCLPKDTECYADEKPRHDVTLTRAHWLSRTEVPVAAYRRFAEATRRSLPPAPVFNAGWAATGHPIVNVTWAEAQAYCEWAGGRLPTEAEWERAARGGKENVRYPWGNRDPECTPGRRLPNGAQFDDRAGCREGATRAVGSFGANGYGLFDMAGNAFEWCSDWYGEAYYAASPKADPAGLEAGTERVLRGGSLNSRARGLRVSLRNHLAPAARSVFVGVRCALSAAP